MNRILSLCLPVLAFIFSSVGTYAQNPYPYTTGPERITSINGHKSSFNTSLLANYSSRNIGPTVFSGRVVDLAVNPDDPTHFFVAYASGGLWETKNNGATLEPVFDQNGLLFTGDLDIHWKTGTIYLGTGEPNSSRSSYAGTGIYKSKDLGKTWEYKGLPESHHIGRVVIHPDNPDKVWVAVIGHLYSSNPERGIYYTADGGTTWQQTLYIDENTGAIDIVIDRENPNILYASTWTRERRAWNFVEAGTGSAIYTSVDGGIKWKKISTSESGFPDGKGTGRIGLSLSKKEGKQYIYALLDNFNPRPEKESLMVKSEDIDIEFFKSAKKEDILELDDKKFAAYLKKYKYPEKYDVKYLKNQVKTGKIEPIQIAEYLEDANSRLFNTTIVGAEVYVSTDQGKTWKRTHDFYLDDMYYTYGYYFGQIITPYNNPDKVYIMGVPILKSEDGGKSWNNINGENVHVDHHALWINEKNPRHLINGNDGGVNISYDDGASWFKINQPAVAQFYYIAADKSKPYKVYGGTQDNGVWFGSHQYKPSRAWEMDGLYPYQEIIGGDGMQVMIDTRDNNTIYTGYQFGNYFRYHLPTKKSKYITPKHKMGDRPYRWNWQTPIHLSLHNQDILYMGANKVLRSLDKGDNFTEISKDLTKGGKTGNVAFGTLTALHESALKFGLIYTGSDDGLAHVSQDGGHHWQLISESLPQDLWVSRIQASAHEESRVYISLNGYRWDNFEPYIYRSEDYGKTWTRIGENLPLHAVNVIKEDLIDENIVYVGTDHGIFISFDKGLTFEPAFSDVPPVAVHDIVHQDTEDHLLIGTHGRSIYLVDLALLRKRNEIGDADIKLFPIGDMKSNPNWGVKRNPFTKTFLPQINFDAFSKTEQEATLAIADKNGITIQEFPLSLKSGLASYNVRIELDENAIKKYVSDINKGIKKKEPKYVWPLMKGDHYLLPQNEYKVILKSGKLKSETSWKIKE